MDSASLKRMTELLADLQRESDRGLALVGAAFIDEKLKLALLAHLHGDKKEIERELLAFNRPLGEAKTRLRLSLALGLIDTDEYHDIALIYEVRNKFSHQVLSQSFEGSKDDTSIPDKIKLLKGGLTGNMRSQFLTAVVLRAMALWYRSDWVQKYRTEEPVIEKIRDEELAISDPLGMSQPK